MQSVIGGIISIDSKFKRINMDIDNLFQDELNKLDRKLRSYWFYSVYYQDLIWKKKILIQFKLVRNFWIE